MDSEYIGPMLKLLAERSRASEDIVASFRPPHAGIVEQVGANRHQIVHGRRGVGKSMLLLSLVAEAKVDRIPIVYVDLERYRDTPYPDVLIRLLNEVTLELSEAIAALSLPSRLRLRKLRKELLALETRLANLINEPQQRSVVMTESESDETDQSHSASLTTSASCKGQGANLSGERKKLSRFTQTNESTSEFRESKMQGLHREASIYGDLLGRAVGALGGDHAILVLDDFYFVPREFQPDVLAYLHQVLKGRRVWLKIGGVEHRLVSFREGDPPTGLQPYHDAGVTKLDATLRDYSNTKLFLEGILAGIGQEIGVQLSEIATETGRERLVLASGGVPRDYINIAAAALQHSTVRDDKPNRPANKINAEDVSYVAPDFLKQKEEDLGLDADSDDAERLRRQFDDLVAFCVHDKKKEYVPRRGNASS